MTVKYAELFAGVGGFRLGIEQSGVAAECVYANEIDKHASAVYRHIWRGNNGHPCPELEEGDICEQRTEDIPDINFLTAGFPCQSFSIAGRLGGFQDTRGTLFFEVARFLQDKRPRHFLLENVKNLVGHDKGETFQTILGVLADLGYRVEWEVLNSTCWVPQNRERVFLVGHLGGGCPGEVFPIREDDSGDTKDIGEGGGAGSGVSSAIDSNYWKGPDGKRTMVVQVVGNNKQEQHIRLVEQAGALKLQNQENARSGGTTLVVHKTFGHPISVKYGETGCLQGGGMNVRDKTPNVSLTNDISSLRRLTPTECERLQGWPDLHTAIGLYRASDLPKSRRNGSEYEMDVVSDTQRYRMAGNGVTAPVVREIVKKMALVGCFDG